MASFSSHLATELAEETSKGEEDTELRDITQQMQALGFSITELPGEGLTTMTRKHNGELIEVSFDCQDQSGDGDMDDLEAMLTNEDKDDEDFEGAMEMGINFTVKVSKDAPGSKAGTLCFDCVAAQTLSVTNLQVSFVNF